MTVATVLRFDTAPINAIISPQNIIPAYSITLTSNDAYLDRLYGIVTLDQIISAGTQAGSILRSGNSFDNIGILLAAS
jgi:hypothetical protein